jgi:ABC-type multidrug transport system ATPase subunit
MTSGLRLHGVCLRYGNTDVLRDVSFSAAPGAVVGLVGPNGAGKSSLARVATGFTLPHSGTATMNGLDARTYRLRHGIGYAPEELPRPGSWRVRTLFTMRGGAGGEGAGSDSETRARSGASTRARMLETLCIEPLLDRSVHTLSKGQWRAVLLAYAALGESRLIVLDEPDSGLDPGALDRLGAYVEILRGTGAVVLVLSHQLFELERTCDRVAFVRAGRIVSEEPARAGGASLRQRYREVFA